MYNITAKQATQIYDILNIPKEKRSKLVVTIEEEMSTEEYFDSIPDFKERLLTSKDVPENELVDIDWRNRLSK
ncbi:MAG: hypothetical protein LBK70_00300 [Clostridiales bacterium]|jgi:hypothetical protein|nr:hypothetical protein [Clostridiales bacterium]